jgi:Barstar (barnase inhibitor)
VRVVGSPTAPAVLVRLGIDVAPPRSAQRVLRLDGAAITTWDDVHDALARGFGFPGFYGRNLDALIDCLTLLDDASAGMSTIQVASGSIAVIEIEHVDRMPSAIVATLADTIGLVNYRRRERGDDAIVTLSYARR